MFLLFDNSSLRTSTTILPFFLQQVPYFQETAPQLHADVRSLKPKYTNFSTDQLPSLTHRKSTIRPIPWLHAPVLNSTNDTLNHPRSCPVEPSFRTLFAENLQTFSSNPIVENDPLICRRDPITPTDINLPGSKMETFYRWLNFLGRRRHLVFFFFVVRRKSLHIIKIVRLKH